MVELENYGVFAEEKEVCNLLLYNRADYVSEHYKRHSYVF